MSRELNLLIKVPVLLSLCHIKLLCFNTNMLGMNTMEGVVMLASTNRQDILDQVNSGGLVSTVHHYVSTTATFIRNNRIIWGIKY